MSDDRLADLLQRDPRYSIQAYLFLYECLRTTSQLLGLDRTPRKATEERHVSGQQLLEGIRRHSLRQFGYLAKTVLESWGIKKTDDWGEVVFNLVEANLMHKTDKDRREDFQSGYEFQSAFEDQYFSQRLYLDTTDVYDQTAYLGIRAASQEPSAEASDDELTEPPWL